MNDGVPIQSDSVLDRVLAALVFLGALTVYTLTLTPTVPFWDSGEYIAASWILGVPHAPGTPLYILVGRVFALLPFQEVAWKVNWLSAVSSALGVFFIYLITVKLSRRVFPAQPGGNRWLSRMAGLIAACTIAFGTTYWTNAVEAEVYAGSCALMAFAVWLLLRWEDDLGKGNEERFLLLITYVVALGVGIHLAVAVVAWPVVAYVFLRRPGYLLRWEYVVWALVTWLTLGFGVQKPLLLVPVAATVLGLVVLAVRRRMPILALGSGLLFLLGLTPHLFLIIRANQDPMINEAAPKDWASLWLMVIRDQFKPGSPLDRRADLAFQFGPMYWQYIEENFTLFTAKGKAFFQVPLAVTLVGGLIHLLRRPRSGLAFWLLYAMLGPAMVVYLNFKMGEVRSRDYFFVQNYMFLAVWTGIGAAWFVETLRDHARRPALGRVLAVVVGLALVGLFALPVRSNWEARDRSGFYVARNYAHNMLVGLEPDAVLFTNGDNDTFPLWYMQEVEEFRKDVRVVNLSLLNTRWYLEQIRDLEPKVPLEWTDEEIAAVNHFKTPSGQVVLIKDQAVRRILQVNRWTKPLYLAVSVPDRMGLDDHLRMEGLVFRVVREPVESTVDVDAMLTNLGERYIYQGTPLQDPAQYATDSGTVDPEAFRDTNSLNLLQNYAAAHVQLALALAEDGRTEEAAEQVRRAQAVSPRYPALGSARGYILEKEGRWEEALAHYETVSRSFPGDWVPLERSGAILVRLQRYREAIPLFEQARERAPDTFEPYRGLLSSYYNLGLYAPALQVLRAWAARHPEDEQVNDMIAALERSIETGEDPFGADSVEGADQ